MNADYYIKLIALFVNLFLFITPVMGEQVIETLAKSPKSKNVMLILDASRSMWGQINKKAKITIAKNKIEELFVALPDHLNLSLMAYGHRRRHDCDDIQLFGVKAGGASRERLRARVGSISPRGKTPITRALELGLQHVGQGGALVLVSDGKETCQRDPCAYIKQAKNDGMDFKVHVIGFDVNDEEKRQLDCIANASGGKFLAADNIEEFKFAFDEVKKELVKIELGEPIIDEPLSITINPE